MARKRLSDLLREEGEKPEKQTASENKTSASKTHQPQIEEQSTNNGADEEPTISVTAEVIATQAEQVEDFINELRDAAAEPEMAPDHASSIEAEIKADLEKTIAALKADLEAVQQALQDKEAAMQNEVASLQAKITAQETTIQQLQTDIQQAESLKAELDTAKQTILQLTQSNAKPTSRPSVLPSTRAAEPELEPNRAQMVVPPAKSAPVDRPKLHQLALRKVLDHPVQPTSLPPMSSEKSSAKEEVKLSDTDVGWMD